MSTPLSLEKPNISESFGINVEDDHDYILLKSSGNILAWNNLVSSQKGSKKPIKNETARFCEVNSSTASTKGSSATCQEKKEIDTKDSLNSSCFVEKKDEVDFGGLSTGENQISTMLAEERFDSEDNFNKISKLNLNTQEVSEEDVKPEDEGLIEQMETETDTVMPKPSTSLFPEEEDYMLSSPETLQCQQARKSKKARTPQSKCKNIYKTILLEIFKIFICLYNLNEPQYKKICGKIQISDKEWGENVLKNKVLVTALENEQKLTEQDFEKWLKKNKVALKNVLEEKKLGLFVPFYEEIRETKRYIKKDNPMDYFKTYKKNTSQEYLKNLSKEGELICWILVVKFSLIWLPKGSPSESMKLLPVKQDTIGMVYWMITTRTAPKVKNLLKNFKEREHLRNILQDTFDVMEKSARQSYPQMRNLLDRIKIVECYIPEPSLTITERIIEEVQCIPGKEKEPMSALMQTHLAFEAFEDSYYEALRGAQSKSWFDLLDFNEEQGERCNLNTLPRYVPNWKMQIEYIKQSCDSQNDLMEVEEKVTPKEKRWNNGDGKTSQFSFIGEFEEEGMVLNKKVKKR